MSNRPKMMSIPEVQMGKFDLLPETQQAVFKTGKQGYEEIAEVLGLPIGTVKSRINRGRKALRAMMNVEDLTSRELIKENRELLSGTNAHRNPRARFAAVEQEMKKRGIPVVNNHRHPAEMVLSSV